MRRLRFAGLLALVALASSGFASPLFGKWSLELNGQPVTVTVSYVERHVEGKMIVGSGASARELPMLNVRIMDRPPSTLQFDVENLNGAGKTTFELHTIDGEHATLRQVGGGLPATEVKAVKQR